TEAHAQVTESLEQQTATGEILRVIASSPTDVEPVFRAIAASAGRLLGGLGTAVTRFDGDQMHVGALDHFTPEADAMLRSMYPRPPSRQSLNERAVLDSAVVDVPVSLNNHSV